MRQLFCTYVSIILVWFTIPQYVYSQCQINSDFNNYNAYGLPTTITWDVEASNSVECNSSDWQPSFFVNQDSLLNVRITGEIFISSSASDDDFVGFVFGYEAPNNQMSSVNNYYLFDWKRVSQHAPEEFGGFLAREGFSLIEFDNFFTTDPQEIFQVFWGHEELPKTNILDTKYGNNLGWELNTYHQFELIYTQNLIRISIDGVNIFEVEGCYEQGLFGLYSFNQSNVDYKNVVIEQYYDFDYYVDGSGGFCQFLPISFQLLDDECYSYPESLTQVEWNFDDGTPYSNDVNPVHIFEEEGRHNVELYLHNIEGCIDTITKEIIIEPGTFFNEQPQDVFCNIGDNAVFTVESQNATSYKWYYKAPEMNGFVGLKNDSIYSGVYSAQMTVNNVIEDFDLYEYQCYITGPCINNNGIASNRVKLHIVNETPISAHLLPEEDEFCVYDSIVLNLKMDKLYQAKDAFIKFNYNASQTTIVNYNILNTDLDFEINIDSNSVDIFLDVHRDYNFEESIIASFILITLDSNNRESFFTWDEYSSYFVNNEQDTLVSDFYNSDILIHSPIQSDLQDSIRLCRGSKLLLDNQLFNQVLWSNGSNAYEMEPIEDGEYWVYLSDINNCISYDTFNIQIDEIPIKPIGIITEKDNYCSFDDSIVFSIEGGYGDYLKILYGSQQIIDTSLNKNQYKMSNPREPFRISASWVNICGESPTETSNINVIETAVPNIEIFSNYTDVAQGETISFTTQIQDGGEDPLIFWLLDNQVVQSGISPNYYTNELFGDHSIKTVMHSNATCVLGDNRAFDEFKISLDYKQPIYIPSIVTPNGDGVDDNFRVLMKPDNLQYFELHIFDLSGKIVFHTNRLEDVWNGDNILYNGGVRMLTYLVTYKQFDNVEQIYTGKFILKK